MASILRTIVELLAKVHNAIIHFCNVSFGGLSDKWLHFIVIGLVGMAMIAIIYPMFKHLAEDNRIMTITWIYVFTMLVVITFAIEIGQKITNTGNMEFADIVAGLAGFMSMFAAMLVIWAIVILIKRGLKKRA